MDPTSYGRIATGLRPKAIQLPAWNPIVTIHFEKSDPHLEAIVDAIRSVRYEPILDFVPFFEVSELDEAELLIMRVRDFCGEPFLNWALKGGYPANTLILDTREITDWDIAVTYAREKEVVISRRLFKLLQSEHLTGWRVEPILDFVTRTASSYFRLLATNTLPPLAADTEIYHERSNDGSTWTLVERGPLRYDRESLEKVDDFNWTQEKFLEPPWHFSYFIVTQSVRRAFATHQIKGKVDYVPVIIS